MRLNFTNSFHFRYCFVTIVCYTISTKNERRFILWWTSKDLTGKHSITTTAYRETSTLHAEQQKHIRKSSRVSIWKHSIIIITEEDEIMTITKVINYKTNKTILYVLHERYQNVDFIEDACSNFMTTSASGDDLDTILKNLITYDQAKEIYKKFL